MKTIKILKISFASGRQRDTQDTHFLLVMITTRQEVGRRVSRRVTRCHHPTFFKLFRFFFFFFIRKIQIFFFFFGGKLDKICAVAPIQKSERALPFLLLLIGHTQHAQRGGGRRRRHRERNFSFFLVVSSSFPG